MRNIKGTIKGNCYLKCSSVTEVKDTAMLVIGFFCLLMIQLDQFKT